jgi:hypothetical protein
MLDNFVYWINMQVSCELKTVLGPLRNNGSTLHDPRQRVGQESIESFLIILAYMSEGLCSGSARTV